MIQIFNALISLVFLRFTVQQKKIMPDDASKSKNINIAVLSFTFCLWKFKPTYIKTTLKCKMNVPNIQDYSLDLQTSFNRYLYLNFAYQVFQLWKLQGFGKCFQVTAKWEFTDAFFGGQALNQQPGSFQKGSSRALLGFPGPV